MSPNRSRAMRVLSCCIAGSLAYSSCAIGINDIVQTLSKVAAQRVAAGQIGNQHYTDHARPAFIGAHPGRLAFTRGSLWAGQLAETMSGLPLFAQVHPNTGGGGLNKPTSTLAGVSYPWEGSQPAAGGSVNTSNGDKLTLIPLLSWPIRGGTKFDLTLAHNSETNDNGPFGQHWTWTFDVYVATAGGYPVIHWGDGLCVPYMAAGQAQGSGTLYPAPAGIYDQLVQNSNGTWTITKKDGAVYQLNASAFLTSITDRNGNAISVTRNTNNYVTSITDPTGRTVTMGFNTLTSKYTSITDPAGNVYTITVDGSSNLTSIGWPSIGDSKTYTDGFAYDSGYRILTHTDRRGKAWGATYNSDGSLKTETDPLSHIKSYTYTGSSTTVTDPLSHTRTDNYSSGMLASSVDESGYSVNFTSRDTNHNVLTEVDKRGKTWTYTYDTHGNALTETDPLSHQKVFTYNSFSEMTSAKDALLNLTQWGFDTRGNLLTVTNPLSKVTQTNTYDSYGQRQTSANALGKTTTYSYDSNGNVHTVTDPLTNQTTYAYDTLGRLTSVTDPLSHTESYAYDAWERQFRTTHADSSTVVKSFDGTGNVVSITDELSHTTANVFDNAGRLTSTTNARNDTENYGYDNADRRTSVTNGNGKTRSYTFTNRGEVATLTHADGAVEQWNYDGEGHTTAYINALNQTVQYGFDDAGRQTGITYPIGTNVTFGYDNSDRRTSMTDATGTTTWGYDAASRLTSLTSPQGANTYGYDDADRRTSMTEPNGSWSYGYDDDSRLTTQTNPFSETTTFSYDPASRKTGQTLANGQVDVVVFDNRNRETSVSHQQAGGTVLSAESYVYDYAGNLSSKTADGATTSYGYDSINEITSETAPTFAASYTYDSNGNRLTKTVGASTDTYTYDNADKLSSVTNGGTTVKSYGYDTAGRTTSVTSAVGVTTLAYDYEDRVTGIQYPSGATNSFAYNGLDTRVGKVDSSGTYTYNRDGADVTDPVLSDGHAAYTLGISQSRSGVSTFELSDRLGTSTKQADATQTLTASRTYDAFGMLVSTSGTPQGPFGFVGNEGYQSDPDSALMLLGHRYYDPSTGRFLTRDPAQDGRNWYAYCQSSPTNATDEQGLEDHSKTDHRCGQIVNHSNDPVTGVFDQGNGKDRKVYYVVVPPGYETDAKAVDIDYVKVHVPLVGDTWVHIIGGTAAKYFPWGEVSVPFIPEPPDGGPWPKKMNGTPVQYPNPRRITHRIPHWW